MYHKIHTTLLFYYRLQASTKNGASSYTYDRYMIQVNGPVMLAMKVWVIGQN
jgi:hypothetical protein